MADSETSWPNVLTPLPGQTWNDGDMAVFDLDTNTFRPQEQGGGGGGDATPDAVYEMQLSTGSLFGSVALAGTVQLISSGDTNSGDLRLSASVPMSTFAPGDTIFDSALFSLSGTPLAPADVGGLDLSMSVTIASLDGANWILLGESANIPVGETAGNLDSGDDGFTSQAQTGTDLVFVSGVVTSTAGGVYGTSIQIIVAWD